jgi:hypothetical protein
VEELEERLGDQMDAVLGVIRDSISADGVPAESSTHAAPPSPQAMSEEKLFLEEDDITWDYHDEQLFDDTGEGAGIEGDLEAEDN